MKKKETVIPAKVKLIKKFTKKIKEELLETVRLQLKEGVAVVSANIYKVNLNFTEYGKANFIVYINNVLVLIADSDHYTTPSPTLDIINNMIRLEAVTRSAKNTIDANTYLKSVKNLMRQLCVYIANNCDNDVVILRSVGVRENQPPGGPRVKASRAKIIDVKDTINSGSVKATVETVKGMQGITAQWMLKNDENMVWHGGYFSTGVSVVISGMPIGATVLIQIRFKSADGYGDWSISKEWVVR
jgi:hypothetical protein